MARLRRVWKRMNAKAFAICLLMYLSATACAQVGLSPGEWKMFNLVNQERKKVGLPQLQWDYHLAESARIHAELMAERSLFTHQLPGEAASNDRMGAAGARFDESGENIALGDVAPDVVEVLHGSLMNSPGHRANILSSTYNAVGLAIVAHKGQTFVTEDFAHTVATYSDEQFRTALIAAFNKARQASGLPAVTVKEDSSIHDLACSESDRARMPRGAPGSLEIVFTSSQPDKLSSEMQKITRDALWHQMSIGTCFHPDQEHGYANFWVIVEFYP